MATNTDMSIPQARGIAPGNGTLVAAVAAATGQRPLVAGKPEAPLFHAAAKRLAADRPLVVGDRLDTDILGGNNAGFATVAVLTGVDTRESILAARTLERPDYLINDLTDLYRALPCRGVTTPGSTAAARPPPSCDGQTVRVSGDPGDLDAWRAACSAWWAANPETATRLGAGPRMAGSLGWHAITRLVTMTELNHTTEPDPDEAETPGVTWPAAPDSGGSRRRRSGHAASRDPAVDAVLDRLGDLPELPGGPARGGLRRPAR